MLHSNYVEQRCAYTSIRMYFILAYKVVNNLLKTIGISEIVRPTKSVNIGKYLCSYEDIHLEPLQHFKKKITRRDIKKIKIEQYQYSYY